MHEGFFWSPKAVRADRTIIKRLENRTLKQYDRYMLEREQEEAERIRALARQQKEDSSQRSDEEPSEKPRMSSLTELQLLRDEMDSRHSLTSSKSSMMAKSWKKVGVCGNVCTRWCVTAGQPFILNWWEYLTFLIFLNTSMVYQMMEMQIVAKWGANLVLFNFILTEVVIGIPTYMIYMFLGSYAKRSYIRFWDCVPIMKGIGYSIFFLCGLTEIFNMTMTSMCVLYVYELTGPHIPWLTCDFPGAHKDCIPIVHKNNHNATQFDKVCCSLHDPACTVTIAYNQSAKYATHDFYVSYMLGLNYDYSPSDTNLIGWKVVVVVLWGITSILLTIGLRNYRKLFAWMNIGILGILVILVTITIFVSPGYKGIKATMGNYDDLLNFEAWLDTMILNMYKEVPSDVLTICAISIPAISTTSDTVVIYAIKIAVYITSIVWLAIVCNSIQLQYNIVNGNCILIQGDLYFFALLPDQICRMVTGHLMLIVYFCIIFMWNYSVTVNILNSGLEAILEEFPYLVKWRLPVAGFICTVLCGLNIPVLKPHFMHFFKSCIESSFSVIIVTQIIASLAGMFLYSVDKIVNDYHFINGVRLSQYWTIGMKASMLVFTVMAILVVIWESKEGINGIIIALVLWTIPVGMILMSLRYYMRVNKSLIESNPMWGPPSKKRKTARLRFDPTHELKYRSMVQKCKHYCLLKSTGVRREIKHWRSKLDACTYQLTEEVDNEGVFEAISLGSGESHASNEARKSLI